MIQFSEIEEDNPNWMEVLKVFYEHEVPQIPKTGSNGPAEDPFFVRKQILKKKKLKRR